MSDERGRTGRAEAEARRAGQMERVALIVAAIALSILGLFRPLRLS